MLYASHGRAEPTDQYPAHRTGLSAQNTMVRTYKREFSSLCGAHELQCVLGEVFVLYPARSARVVSTRRTCDPGQPRRAAISTFQIEPPRKCAHLGTSHAPRKSLEATVRNAWSSLLAQGKLLASAHRN